jgi:hypothetical protein
MLTVNQLCNEAELKNISCHDLATIETLINHQPGLVGVFRN